MKSRYSLVKHFDFLFLDLLCIEFSFLLACQVRQDAFVTLFKRYIFMAGIIVAAFLFIIMFWNIYSGILRRNFFDEFKSTFSLVAGIFVALTMYCFITKTSEDYSRAVMLTFAAISFPLTLIVRVVWKEHVRKNYNKTQGENLLFIREEDAERRIDRFTGSADSGVIVSGIVTYEPTTRQEIGGVPVVCSREGLQKYVETHEVNCVYIHLRGISVNEYVDILVREGIPVYQALRSLEKSSFRYKVEEMNGYKTLCVREWEIPLGRAIFKRLEDIVGAILGLILTLPITLVTAIRIKAEDGGPVIYVSNRVGQNGKIFHMYKFRSMQLQADRLEEVLTPEQLEQYYKEYKLEDDPRLTRIGRKIRKYSIDEIPQFVNILKGEMSFVGPRPLVEQETYIYGDKRDLLLSLKPGLTGYWQAYGRNKVTYESGQRQAMELYYVQNFNGWFDFKILLRTVRTVVTADGAR